MLETTLGAALGTILGATLGTAFGTAFGAAFGTAFGAAFPHKAANRTTAEINEVFILRSQVALVHHYTPLHAQAFAFETFRDS